jgi:hypothetical protein
VFFPDKAFQPCGMLVGKVRSLPEIVAPERFSNQVASCLTNKYYTRLGRLVKDKHSSLIGPLISYEGKYDFRIWPLLAFFTVNVAREY